ncbi:MAG: sulfite dehydrogenase [bacterium]
MTKPTEQEPRLTRREMLQSAGIAAGVALSVPLAQMLAQAPAAAPQAAPVPPSVPLDATRVPGLPSGPLTERSPFEKPALAPLNVSTGATNTPHQQLRGTITPSDLHFQRHHNGIALIDPAKYSLTIHGLVERPLTFTLDDLKRFPAETQTYFIECAGNGRAAYRTPKPEMTPQDVDGMTSNSEWTGVLVSTLLREAGVNSSAKWVLAEGGDAAVLSRSIPMEKMQDDALIAYAQNGEAVRAANGYPARLVLPGYEGNMCIKWLRRLKVISEPNMSRDETVKYTDPLPDGTSRQFSFVMDAKSIITSPVFPEKLSGTGWRPITGIAWTGRGKITSVDVSVDGGRTWEVAEIVGLAQSNAHTRFQYMWKWNGKPATLMSRAHDETGYTQPTLEEFRRVRGKGTDYHFNAIRSWNVAADGTVGFGG